MKKNVFKCKACDKKMVKIPDKQFRFNIKNSLCEACYRTKLNNKFTIKELMLYRINRKRNKEIVSTCTKCGKTKTEGEHFVKGLCLNCYSAFRKFAKNKEVAKSKSIKTIVPVKSLLQIGNTNIEVLLRIPHNEKTVLDDIILVNTEIEKHGHTPVCIGKKADNYLYFKLK